MNIEYRYLIGKEMLSYIQTVSEMRIKEFENYPYLYKGNFEYEKNYMTGFANDPKSCLGIAKNGDTIVGISTGMPLKSDAEILKDAELVYKKADKDPTLYYYFGEFIVHPQFRGQGISKQLAIDMEAFAKNYGFSKICLLTVIRSVNDPRKPTNYIGTDHVWRALGFTTDQQTIDYHSPTILESGEVKDIMNPMQFWSKDISNVNKNNPNS